MTPKRAYAYVHLLWTLLSRSTIIVAFTSGRRSHSSPRSLDRWTNLNPRLSSFPLSAKSSKDELVADSFQNQTVSDNALTLATKTTKDTNVLALQTRAAALRAEIACIEKAILASKEVKRQKELADIDRWIEECLYVSVKGKKEEEEEKGESSARIELLNSEEKAAEILRDNRYSHEHVSKMFERICDTSPAQSRSNCSPLLALLVGAAGKLDCVDRDENPNKRWDGRVERDLRKRLFAMDWGIHLESPTESNDRFL